MKIVLSTLPAEGQFTSWLTPATLNPVEVKYIPLGLLSLASNISPSHEVIILDPASENWTIEQTVKYINEQNADVVGFSVVSRKAYALYKLLSLVEAEWKIVGGPHCTNYFNDIITRGADTVFVGGLADLEFRDWVENPIKGIINCTTDIKLIKFPNRKLINYENYFYSGKVLFEASRRMSMFSSVGCSNRCSFCTVQGKKVDRRLPGVVLDEMTYLRDACGANSIHIMDDNFNMNSNHVASILDLMEAQNWSTEWSIRGQVKFDLSLVPRMAKLGLKRIHVGVEALDNNLLKWCRKAHRVADVEDFCIIMNENNIEVLAYFIIGIPGETASYRKELPDKIRALHIKYPYVNILFPEPQTSYYNNLVKEGVYDKDLWKDYFADPAPNYELPPPFGYIQKDALLHCADNITKEFSC